MAEFGPKYERDLARRLHAAATKKGKAEAAYQRFLAQGNKSSIPLMVVLSRLVSAQLDDLIVHLEACAYFEEKRSFPSTFKETHDER